MVIYVIPKNGGNDNSTYYLNLMVNYHYHSENRVINWQLPYMVDRADRPGTKQSWRGGEGRGEHERTDIGVGGGSGSYGIG